MIMILRMMISPKQVRQLFHFFPLSRATASPTRCEFERAKLSVFMAFERCPGAEQPSLCCCLVMKASPRYLEIRQKQRHIEEPCIQPWMPTISVSLSRCETLISELFALNTSSRPVMALDHHYPNSYALIVICTLSARHVYTTRLNEGCRMVRTRSGSCSPQPVSSMWITML
jgi:hypothetical protein